MGNVDTECTCQDDGYSPHCPYAFFQGNQILHQVKGDGRLKKRFEIIKTVQGGDDRVDVIVNKDEPQCPPTQRDVEETLRPNLQVSRSIAPEMSVARQNERLYADLEANFGNVPRPLTTYDERNKQSNLVDTEDMLASNREILRKYEPLRIGNNSLTQMSIGGFEVDLSKAAQKAAEVAPLPPAKLPKIYIDHDMNFNHHFFQGLERLMGREQVLDIVHRRKYYTDEVPVLLPLIEGFIKSGYEKKDTNLTVFTKSALSSTFELDERTSANTTHRGLIVAANLWGFQYIEPGMEMKEADLKMWLRVCYNKFENIFFNTFKDSGMPDFATNGVQTRYEAVAQQPKLTTQEVDDLNQKHEANVSARKVFETPYDSDQKTLVGGYSDNESVRTVSHHRRRRQRKPEPSLGDIFFGKRR